MNRSSILSFVVVATGTGALLAGTAVSQVGPPKSYVALQPTTPGTSQSGHLNVSGTIRSSQLVGGGAGITGVNADLLDGLNSTAFLQSVPVPLTLSGTSSSFILSAQNSHGGGGGGSAVFGWASASSGNIAGVLGQCNSDAGFGVAGQAVANSGTTFGGYFRSFSQSGRGVYGFASANIGSNYGVYGQSSSTSGQGVYGIADAGTGSTYGVFGQSASPNGTGAYGLATSATGLTKGITGQSASDAGVGVYGWTNSTTGATFGGLFESVSTSGRGVFGGAFALSGATFGVYGQASSTSGRAVYGHAIASSGVTFGVHGIVNSPDGFAGYFDGRGQFTGNVGIGVAPSARRFEVDASDQFLEAAHINNAQGGGLRVDSLNGTAVWALTSNGFAGIDARHSAPTGLALYAHATGSTNINYGVLGHTDSATGYGVFSLGNTGASGVKSFRIDHPFDPANKYLLHYSHEGPEPQNVYNGNVVTDSKGYATISLPEYFEEINRDPRYSLTVVDDGEREDFVLVKVVNRIRGNRFTIRTSVANVEVSWRVDAVRNDAWIQKHGAPVEVEKAAPEKGTYQHPDLFGESRDRGIFAARETQMKPK